MSAEEDVVFVVWLAAAVEDATLGVDEGDEGEDGLENWVKVAGVFHAVCRSWLSGRCV